MQLQLLAQSQEVRNYYDEEREQIKERYFVSDFDAKSLYGAYESYYISGQLKSVGAYVDNEPIRQWQYYYENGQLKMQGHLKNNSNHGLWTYYYENGSPRMKGNIYEGLRQKQWTYYFETGEIKSDGEYVDDKKDGIWNYYFQDGSLKAKAVYKLGDGIYKEFYGDGTLKMDGYITDGKSDSLWSNYYESGALQSRGTYIEGERSGPWTFFYENGSKSSLGFFKNNLAHGKWVYYYPNGALQSEGAEREGKKEGYWKLYYEDGITKGETVYEAGTGDYKEFYENGKLKLRGRIVDGNYEGKWIYYFESGEVEGMAEYLNNEGEYIGYYVDGTEKMKGDVRGQDKIGTWELYNDKGQIAGYYKPVYENYEMIFNSTRANLEEKEQPKYNKPEYRYRPKRMSYMKARNSDFSTILAQVNPFNMLFGDLQIAAEYNIQQRLGYELVFHVYRNPFFIDSYNLSAGESFFEGIGASFRQRFYHEDSKFGMPYFGHSIGYQHLIHQKHYTNTANDNEATAELKEQSLRYGLFIGTRILQNLNDSGFTFDINTGINLGYHNYNKIFNTGDQEGVFSNMTNSNFKVAPIFGLSIGYVFRLKKVSTLNP
jgi:antitoxin component YwqK of YwqJK toxin-antitoxin module